MDEKKPAVHRTQGQWLQAEARPLSYDLEGSMGPRPSLLLQPPLELPFPPYSRMVYDFFQDLNAPNLFKPGDLYGA